MRVKLFLKAIALTAVLTFSSVSSAFATVKPHSTVSPIKLVVDTDYLESKVNDPVSRKTMPAFIVSNNAEFHLISSSADMTQCDVVFYINEFIGNQDAGSRTRILKKRVNMGETLTMLPEEKYEKDVANGSAYDFTKHCYVVRVYSSADRYQDYYFGLVDENVYANMYDSLQATIAANEAN